MQRVEFAERALCLLPASQQPPALQGNERQRLGLPTHRGCIPEDEGPGEMLLFASRGWSCPASEGWQRLSPTGMRWEHSICCSPKHRSRHQVQVSSSNTSPDRPAET